MPGKWKEICMNLLTVGYVVQSRYSLYVLNSSITNLISMMKTTENHFTVLDEETWAFCLWQCLYSPKTIWLMSCQANSLLSAPWKLDNIFPALFAFLLKVPLACMKIGAQLAVLMFALLTFSFLEVCVNSSFETFLMPLYHWRFSLGLSSVLYWLPFTHTVEIIYPLLSSTKSDLAKK